MNSQDYVDFLNACIKESDDIWRDRKKVMRECYDRYRSYRDYSKKKGWQHKIVAPTVYPAVKGASGLIRRILMKSDAFFQFVQERQDNAPNQVDPMTGQPIEDQMDNFARAFTKKVRFHIDECDFIGKFEEAVESSLACMLGVLKFTPKLVMDTKVVWGPVPMTDPETGEVVRGPSGEEYIKEYGFVQETTERGKLFCEVVNPLLLRFPEDHSYLIEETRIPLYELLENAEGLDLNKREVNRLKKEDYESAPTTEAEQDRLKMLNIREHKNMFRKEVVLHIYHGPVTDRKGNLVEKNARFVVANQKYLITKPGPVPYWLRNHNYVLITPLKVLFQAIGAGMIDGIRPIVNAIDNLVNIAGDKMLYAMLPPSEINVDALKDPQQAEGGLVPGKLFKTQGPLGQALRQVPSGDVPQGGFTLIELFKMFIQNYTGWTEFMQGMPSRRGTTATEVTSKTEASSLSFENIASSIEKSGVIESVELVRDLTIQYFMDPTLNPETLDIFMQEKIDLMNLPDSERFAFINKRYPIKVKGLTAFFDKEKDRKDLIDLVGVIAQVPALAARLNLEEFLTRVINTFDWPNPEMLVLAGGSMIDPETGMAMPPGQMYPSPLGAGTGQPPGVGGNNNPQVMELLRAIGSSQTGGNQRFGAEAS